MRLVEIFTGSTRAEMYLYVDKTEGLERVPENLRSQFGVLRSVMILLLTPNKKLARVSAQAVLDEITQQGYYLQLPPSPEFFAEQQIAAMIEAENQLQDGQTP